MALVVTAIHTFVAEHSDELEFQAGEKITILEKDDAFGDGWWKGRNEKGDEGLFPATYIAEGDVDAAPTADSAPVPPAQGAAATSLAPTDASTNNGPQPNSRSGSPIPVPPSPKREVIQASTPPPAAPDAGTNTNGLASPFTPPQDEANRNSLLDVTGQPHSAPSVIAASQGDNVMGSTIGEVQEAIDTMGTGSPNASKGVQLKDPQELGREAFASKEAPDEEQDVVSPIGIASDARARLAEQARLANEERERQHQRDSGGIADLIYSDESDDEEESPTHTHHSRGSRGVSVNGSAANGSAQNYVTSPTDAKADTPTETTAIVTPTTATAPVVDATPRPSTSPRASTGAYQEPESSPAPPAVQPEALQPATQMPEMNNAATVPTSPPAAPSGILLGGAAAAGAAGAAAYAGSRNVSGASAATTSTVDSVPTIGKRSSSIAGSPSMGGQDQLAGHGSPPATAVPAPVQTTFPTTANDTTSNKSLNKPPAQWTVEEVVEWGRSKGFDENICAKFVEHDISGDVLLELDATNLKELEIPQFGKRVRIATAINELRRPASGLSGTSPQPEPHSARSAPPTAFAGSTSPVVDGDQSWGHGRKVSMTPSTPAIDESSAMSAPLQNVNGNGPSRSVSASLPNSPAATATAASSIAATTATLTKRESTSSLGHKKKASLDRSDRLSFFGRSRKAPPMPSQGSNSGSRMAFSQSKPTTTMTAAQPERRTSSGPAAAANIGSAMRTIGTPDKTGYLKKRGDQRLNTWKTRFFVLKGSHLYYLKSESEDRVKGRIDLRGHRIIVDENTNPGSYGFRLVGPGSEKPHYFSSSEQGQIRDWMKALMKATIARDYTVPVTSSCNIRTIPLAEAQALQPRPPSPSQIDATQRANRRENVNQLTPRDASVLMSLDTSSARRMTSHGSIAASHASLGPSHGSPGMQSSPALHGMSMQGSPRPHGSPSLHGSPNVRGSPNLHASPGLGLGQTPSRPSRDMRRASAKGSIGRPSIASYYPPEDEHHAELMNWVNTILPPQYPRAAYFPNSFISGEVIFLIVKHLSGVEPNPPLSPNAFARDATGQPNVEGLFAMMDCVIDAGIDSAGVSLNEIRAGDPSAIATLLDSVRAWATKRAIGAQ